MIRLLHILLCILLAVEVCAREQQQPYSKERLEQAITQYEKLAQTTDWHTFPNNLLLRPSDSSLHVPLLQQNLLLLGDLASENVSGNNTYDTTTTLAVRRFQQRHGLVSDGIVGPNTVAALNIPPQQRLEQLRLNLSRFDSEKLASLQEPYAVLNIPDYTLQLVDSGRVLLHMHVIVGEPELKTYPIHSELNMVVLYPYWYVPRSIAVKEIVPILRRNPGYLKRKNMRLERSTASGWVRINPWDVNWHQVSASNFNYRIVQLSGEGNELGRVKFPFPNRLPQYLHDTPHKALFEYPDRAFSHGCIRLEKPEELANYLLAHRSGYSEKKIERLWQQAKPNHYLRVKEPLPLHIVYFTAWVDAQMQVQFRKDVYGFYKPPPLR